MEDFICINAVELQKKIGLLQGAELKLLFMVLFYLNSYDKTILINNSEWRSYVAENGFSVTPERISYLLSSLTAKGLLTREVKGVYTVKNGLLIPHEVAEKTLK